MNCYVGNKFEDPIEHEENCPCEDDDYEWYVALLLSIVTFVDGSDRLVADVATTTSFATKASACLLDLNPSQLGSAPTHDRLIRDRLGIGLFLGIRAIGIGVSRRMKRWRSRALKVSTYLGMARCLEYVDTFGS